MQEDETASQYEESIQKAAEIINRADAVIIGAGSGLSSAAGYEYYHPSPWFESEFLPFIETYSFQTPMDGLYHLFSSNEERWAFIAHFIHVAQHTPAGQPYQELARILQEKEFFILTTNVDMQFGKVFEKERICAFQGDFGFLQCPQPCHDELYESLSVVEKLCEHTTTHASIISVPSNEIPRCPFCGRIMTPWIRDEMFLQGKFWRDSVERYEQFIAGALKTKRTAFIEIGVGGMTPSIIEIPFWNMVKASDGAEYIRINIAKTSVPEQIRDKSTIITADAGRAIHDLAERLESIRLP